ncbi:MAG: response regulator [Gemmatimonadetes bacterium]|nr:response regulator [Gemmatimonadota bacterium]
MSFKIAVVEDNPDNRLLVSAILDDRYELSEYESGAEVLAGLKDDPPDLMLLDISLPEMDGTEVLAWIRKQPEFQALPVIALTAHAMAGDREKFMAAGFNDYVTKPILDEDVLLEAIQRCLSPTGCPLPRGNRPPRPPAHRPPGPGTGRRPRQRRPRDGTAHGSGPPCSGPSPCSCWAARSSSGAPRGTARPPPTRSWSPWPRSWP